MEKDETFFKILSCALELETRKGHLKWTMSELSRKAEVTRSLIYYYFGQSKINLLQEAVRLIGTDLIGLSAERMQLWREGQGQESIRLSRQLVRRLPCLSIFYLSCREQNSDLGGQLRNLEQKYLEKLRDLFPEKKPAHVKTLFALMFGLIFTPIIDDADLDEVVSFVRFPK